MDLDGDGVLDVVNGRYTPSAVYWFRGLGDGKGFAPREELLAGDKRWSMSTTNAADLDGDGLVDLIIGDTKGTVWWSRNEGSATAPKFTERKPLRTVDGDMKVSHKSDPIAVDWDGDGLLDVLVGDECTDVAFFKGRAGDPAEGGPVFAQGVSLLSGLTVDPEHGYRQAKEKIEGLRAIPGYRIRLATADWNNDGELDLLIGNCVEGEREEGQRRGRTTGHVWVLLRKPGMSAPVK